MSEIDRIAEETLGRIYANLDNGIELKPVIRAALLEYGQIVREECAKSNPWTTQLAD